MANRPRKRPQAEIDITAIWNYIAADNVKAADSLIDRIERTFDTLAEQPLAGRARSDLARNRVMSSRQDIDADDMT
jgi:toxin ParE1/3/4